jgi:hypothetical protein
MDIYKYAEEWDYAVDYYDAHSGRIYKITEAKNHDGKIPVEEDGVIIGFAEKKN